MILQALADYYERKRALDPGAVAPEGWELKHPDSRGLSAVMRFYERLDIAHLGPADLRDAMLVGQGLNLSFRLQGEVEPVCHEPWVAQHCATEPDTLQSSGDDMLAQCLITGVVAPVARLHPKVSFVTKKPSPLVAANTNEAPAYASYGKSQALNAPVSQSAASRYSLALNSLLGRDSKNKVQVGDATTIVWADRDTSLDTELAAVFGDDPDTHVDAVRKRLDAARAGTLGADDAGLRFFVLGLAPNASRIAVRFWLHEAFDRLGPRILQHFDHLRIVRQSERDAATPAMYWLLRAIAPAGKAENVPPRLAGEWMRAILEGTPYPAALLNAAVNRCRAEQATRDFGGNVPYLRAAILKACINREHRRRHGLATGHQFIAEELDVNQTDPAYRLGRLFAVLEHIQSAAQPGINATIRDRSTAPLPARPARYSRRCCG